MTRRRPDQVQAAGVQAGLRAGEQVAGAEPEHRHACCAAICHGASARGAAGCRRRARSALRPAGRRRASSRSSSSSWCTRRTGRSGPRSMCRRGRLDVLEQDGRRGRGRCPWRPRSCPTRRGRRAGVERRRARTRREPASPPRPPSVDAGRPASAIRCTVTTSGVRPGLWRAPRAAPSPRRRPAPSADDRPFHRYPSQRPAPPGEAGRSDPARPWARGPARRRTRSRPRWRTPGKRSPPRCSWADSRPPRRPARCRARAGRPDAADLPGAARPSAAPRRRPGLVDLDHRDRVRLAGAQRMLGVVEPRAREPARSGHRAVGQDGVVGPWPGCRSSARPSPRSPRGRPPTTPTARGRRRSRAPRRRPASM